MVILSGSVSSVISQTKQIGDIINSNGIAATLLAVIILILLICVATIFAYFKKSLKMSGDAMKRLIDVALGIKNDNQSSITPDDIKDIVATAIQDANKFENEDILAMFHNFTEIFHKECKNIIEDTGAIGAGIYVFHNGMHSSHGLPFFKMSCVGEWFKKNSGLQSQLISHSGIPLHIFYNVVNGLLSGVISVPINSKSDPQFKCFVQTPNNVIKYLILVPIYDDVNTVMGFIKVDYCSDLTKEEAMKCEEYIKDKTHIIQPILAYNDNYNDIIKKQKQF